MWWGGGAWEGKNEGRGKGGGSSSAWRTFFLLVAHPRPSPLSTGARATAPLSAMFIVWVLYEAVDLPGCLELVPWLRSFDEVAGAGQQGGEDTDNIPYRTTPDGVPGVLEVKQYDVDECATPPE